MKEVYVFLAKVAEPLSQQLFDLRSQITKEACKTIQLIAEVLEKEFEQQACSIFMTDLSLFKVMEGTNNVIVESAHNSVLAILYNTHSTRLIKVVLKQVSK